MATTCCTGPRQSTVTGSSPTSVYPSCRSLRSSCEPLAIDPVRHLHQEAVVRRQIEQVAKVAAEAAGPLDSLGSLPALTPYQEERRARTVLPTEHDVRAELLEVESADVVRVGG